jgi:hypothetical protein
MSRRRAAKAGQPSCISGRLLARKCCERGESTTGRNGGRLWEIFATSPFANNLLCCLLVLSILKFYFVDPTQN